MFMLCGGKQKLGKRFQAKNKKYIYFQEFQQKINKLQYWIK